MAGFLRLAWRHAPTPSLPRFAGEGGSLPHKRRAWESAGVGGNLPHHPLNPRHPLSYLSSCQKAP